MSDRTNVPACARCWASLTLCALCALLAPAQSDAAAPADGSPPEVSATAPREAEASEAWRSKDDARRTPAAVEKIRIGRIFFSPAERRHRRAEKTPVAETSPTSHTAHAERMVVSGAVSSSTQDRAVWINGTAVENSSSVWTDRAGRVWLRDDNKAPHLARPGQTVNPATGAIEDLLPAGAVVRH